MITHSTEHDPPKKTDADRYGRVLCWDGRNRIWVFAPLETLRDCPNRYRCWLPKIGEPE